MTDDAVILPYSPAVEDEGSLTARVRSGTVKFGAGLALGQLFTVGLYLFTARRSAPAAFGFTVSMLVGVTLVGNCVNFGSNVLFVRELSNGRLTETEFVSRWLAKTVAALVVALLVFLGYSFAVSTMPWSSRVGFAATVFLYSVSQTSQAPLQAEGRFGLLSVINIADKGCALAAALALHAAKVPASEALPIAIAIGAGTSSTLALSQWRPHLRSLLFGGVPLRAHNLRNPWRGSGHFGLSSLLVSLASADVMVLGALGGAAAAGLYSAVTRWTQPFILASNAYSQAAYPFVSRAERDQEAWLRTKHGWKLLGPLLVVVALMVILAPNIVHVLLGDSYRDSTPVLMILALGIPPTVVNQPLYSFLQARGRDAWAARAIAIGIAAQFVTLISLSSRGGVAGAIASSLSQWTLLIALVWRVNCVLSRRDRTNLPNLGPKDGL